MNKFAAFLISAFLISFSSLGQKNLVYRGGQKYTATQNWDFNVENYSWTGGLEVQVAVKPQGGLIMLTIATAFSQQFIGGPIVIFLNNGTRITCLDRKIRDRSNSKSKALYFLTENEMAMLAEEPITQIRFAVLSSGGMGG